MKARIAPDSLRRRVWLEVFGADVVDVVSCEPVLRVGPAGARMCYQLDLTSLKLSQYQRIMRYLAERWRLPVDEVLRLMKDPEHGVPIDAEDVTLEAEMRLFV